MFSTDSLLVAKRPRGVALGALEYRSIAIGLSCLDSILKKSPVQVLLAQASSPGKYLVLLEGEVDELIQAMSLGVELGADELLDDLLLPAAAPELWRALCKDQSVESRLGDGTDLPALGMLECYGGPALIGAADTAAKTGAVCIEKLHLLQGIGGKATALISGDIDSVQIALDAGSEHAKERDLFAHSVIIPRPAPGLFHLLGD